MHLSVIVYGDPKYPFKTGSYRAKEDSIIHLEEFAV